MSCSSTLSPPTLASVVLLMPRPSPAVPVPKFDKSARAKPPRMARPMAATTHVPIFEFETRLKKVSIGFRCGMKLRVFRGRAGVHQAARLGGRQGRRHDTEEAGRGQLEDARRLVGPRRGERNRPG